MSCDHVCVQTMSCVNETCVENLLSQSWLFTERYGSKMGGMRAGNAGNMRRSSHPDEETRLANAKVAAWIKETRHQPQEVPSAVAAGITRDDYLQNAESLRESRSVSPTFMLRAHNLVAQASTAAGRMRGALASAVISISHT